MDTTHVLMVPGSYGAYEFNRLTKEAVARLERVLELWQTRKYSHLLLCGGKTMPEKVQTKPEAVLMAGWLAVRGVTEASMILEDESASTQQSIEYAIEKLDGRFARPVPITVVTHLPQAVQCRNIFLAYGYGHAGCQFVFQNSMMAQQGQMCCRVDAD